MSSEERWETGWSNERKHIMFSKDVARYYCQVWPSLGVSTSLPNMQDRPPARTTSSTWLLPCHPDKIALTKEPHIPQ